MEVFSRKVALPNLEAVDVADHEVAKIENAREIAMQGIT